MRDKIDIGGFSVSAYTLGTDHDIVRHNVVPENHPFFLHPSSLIAHPSSLIRHPSSLMPSPALDVLYEDNHLLVLNKPAGLPTMGTPGGAPTLLSVAKDYIKAEVPEAGQRLPGRHEPLGRPRDGRRPSGPHLQSGGADDRTISHACGPKDLLDTRRRNPTSGQRQLHRLAHPGRTAPPHARGRERPCGGEGGPAGLPAAGPATAGCRSWRSSWKRGESTKSACKWPIMGTRLSATASTAASCEFSSGIALHARRLVVAHPVRGEALVFEAPLPKSWPRAWGEEVG